MAATTVGGHVVWRKYPNETHVESQFYNQLVEKRVFTYTLYPDRVLFTNWSILFALNSLNPGAWVQLRRLLGSLCRFPPRRRHPALCRPKDDRKTAVVERTELVRSKNRNYNIVAQRSRNYYIPVAGVFFPPRHDVKKRKKKKNRRVVAYNVSSRRCGFDPDSNMVIIRETGPTTTATATARRESRATGTYRGHVYTV